MKLLDESGDGRPWSVQLDIRDLGGHLDLSAVGALPLGFQVKLGLVRGKYLQVGPHAVEASFVSASFLIAFRAAIVRSVWSGKMPLANTPVVLNLLYGPVGVDPAFHIVWTRFRLMRRYLAHRTLEVLRIFRMLGLIAHGTPGHGSVHLILTSVAEIGFAWDGDEQGWILAALPPCGAYPAFSERYFQGLTAQN